MTAIETQLMNNCPEYVAYLEKAIWIRSGSLIIAIIVMMVGMGVIFSKLMKVLDY